jgi:hypothetical protein
VSSLVTNSIHAFLPPHPLGLSRGVKEILEHGACSVRPAKQPSAYFQCQASFDIQAFRAVMKLLHLL